MRTQYTHLDCLYNFWSSVYSVLIHILFIVFCVTYFFITFVFVFISLLIHILFLFLSYFFIFVFLLIYLFIYFVLLDLGRTLLKQLRTFKVEKEYLLAQKIKCAERVKSCFHRTNRLKKEKARIKNHKVWGPSLTSLIILQIDLSR